MHAVTGLALKRDKIFDTPLELIAAKSAAEAMKIFEADSKLLFPSIAVALVDVVMETNTAGLDLCNYVRHDLQNHVTQLILRTGQPGLAPPREVVDKLDISNYVAKPEATPDRLYVLIKTGIQQYYSMNQLFSLAQSIDVYQAHAHTPAEFFNSIQSALLAGASRPDARLDIAADYGQRYVGTGIFADRAAYDKIKGPILAKAEPDLRSRKAKGTANPVAKVDDYIVLQTQTLRTNTTVTMIIKDPTVPRDMWDWYGLVWRAHLAYMAEILAE